MITVASYNFTKLLSSNVGDEIIVRQSNNKYNTIKLEIVSIDNPRNTYKPNEGKVIINIIEENFGIVADLDETELLIIKQKNSRGKIILKQL